MQVLVSGATGLIGTRLCLQLAAAGYALRRLSRRPGDASTVVWDPAAGVLEPTALAGVESVVHLAGENIAAGRWTSAQKERIRSSRAVGTALLARALATLQPRPQTLICASAIGFYGDRGDELLTESSAPGQGFLPEVCQAWEQATLPAVEAGIRVIHLRIGVVLAREGGALHKMLLPFRLGLGGVVGSGRQYMSWIALDEIPRIVQHCLDHAELSGPVNAVAPHPMTNRDFTKSLGRVLHRPTFFPLPAPAARLAFGQMADELLLSSTRVMPQRLLDSGLEFAFGELEPALRHQLAID